MHKSYLRALKPTLGKTIVSLLVSIFVSIYVGIAYFAVGLFVLPFDAAFSSTETIITGNVSDLEDSFEKPVKSGFDHAISAFFKTFIWIYLTWSVVQLVRIMKGYDATRSKK